MWDRHGLSRFSIASCNDVRRWRAYEGDSVRMWGSFISGMARILLGFIIRVRKISVCSVLSFWLILLRSCSGVRGQDMEARNSGRWERKVEQLEEDLADTQNYFLPANLIQWSLDPNAHSIGRINNSETNYFVAPR
jgi:hypothetical protein